MVTVNGAIDRETDGASRNITVRATSSDTSFTDQVFAIAINDVDEFDVGSVSDSDATANSVNENAATGTVVGVTALAIDIDATNNTITYSLVDDDGGRFTINSSTGVVTVNGAIDREADGASRNITVRATSSDTSFTDQVFAIGINDVDEFDVGAVSDTDGTANAVDENATIGSIVGINVTASDADATNNTITYSLVDNDGGRFAINSSTGVVTVNGAIDRETDGASRNITVRATSSDTSFTDQVFAIAINDVDEFDVGAVTDTDGTANAVDENATVGTVVGIDVTASDADATNNTITYSLVDNDGGRFAINSSTGVVTVNGAIDRETDGASRNITVRATSSDASFTDQVFAIAINDVDEFDVGAVTDADATVNAVDENAVVGTVVGIDASASDADATNNTISYSLVDDDGGRFTINSSTGVVTVNGAIDRETDGASRNITVRATSSDTSFTDQVFTITINPLNDNNPVITSDGGGASASINVLENDLYVSTVAASDADLPAETLTYSIVGGVDAAKFAIDGSTGVLTFVSGPDFESPTDLGANNVYDVVVQVSDGTFADTQSIAVTVNNVADSGQYLDLLNVESFSNNDGTENWSTDWIESDSSGSGPASGNIDVKGGNFRIKVSSTNDNVYREADLSNAVSATLSFTYNSAMQFGDAGQLAVQVSSNGGASYTTLPDAIFDDTTNTGSGSKSIDISSHMAADTRIRLIVTSGGGTKQIKVDNIQISYTPNSDAGDHQQRCRCYGKRERRGEFHCRDHGDHLRFGSTWSDPYLQHHRRR